MRHIVLVIVLVSRNWNFARAYTPDPRWGAASTLLRNTLFVQGGKTNPLNGFNAGDNVNDLISLDLSNAFDLSNPPWQYISGSDTADLANSTSLSQGPAVAFHTLTPFSPTSLLLFGGDGGLAVPQPAAPDSGWLLDVTSMDQPTWTQIPSNSEGEPPRILYQAAAVANGSVWIIGGEKGDGSSIINGGYQFTAGQFSSLPTDSAPPPLYGHAAVTLSNGLVLVMGGATSSGLVSLDTIYTLNTALSPPTWSTLQTSGTAPQARRNFAATVMSDGQVFIHGGAADAADPPQTFLSDGFMLDTTKNPMAWSGVDAVQQLGARADHTAVSQGKQILFAFGWSSGSAANSSVFVFDTSSSPGSFKDSWTPPAPDQPQGTAPGVSNQFPSATGGTSAGASSTISPTGSGPGSGPGSSSTSTAGSTGVPGAPAKNASEHNLTIALATVFGVISLIAVAGSATYIAAKRREERNGGAFHHLQDDSNAAGGGTQLSPHTNVAPEKVRMAGNEWKASRTTPWAFLSGALLGGAPSPKDRVDMLADEDKAEYDDVESFHAIPGPGRRPPGPKRDASGHSFGSSISNWYGSGPATAGWGTGSASRKNWFNQSVTSLKSIGAVLSRPGAANAVESEIPWWDHDAVPLDPFGDDAALREGPEIGAAAVGAGPTALAMNNVSGIAAVGVGMASRPRGGMYASSSSYPYTDPYSQVGSVEGGESVRLLSSRSTPGDPGSSTMLMSPALSSTDHSSSGPSTVPSGSTSSHSGLGVGTPANLASTSLIGGSAAAPATTIRRSDSWWSRFGKTSKLERPLSPTSPRVPTSQILEFRDPQPAPKLVPIKEGSGGSQSSHTDGPNSADSQRRRSMSSVETRKTVDSDAIERMGAMDVIQRVATVSSRRTNSTVDEESENQNTSHSNSSGLLGSEVVQSPIDEPTRPSFEDASSGEGSGQSRRSKPDSVGDRVHAWEKRGSQDAGPNLTPRGQRKSLYGLAPRASLFIANPDDRAGPSTTDSNN